MSPVIDAASSLVWIDASARRSHGHAGLAVCFFLFALTLFHGQLAFAEATPACSYSTIVVPEIVPAFDNALCRQSKYMKDLPDLREHGLQSLTFQFDPKSEVFRGKTSTVYKVSQTFLINAEWAKTKYQELVNSNIPDGCDSVSASDYSYSPNADGTLSASVVVSYQARTCTKSTCYKGWHSWQPYPIFETCDAKTDVPGGTAKVRIHTTLTPGLAPDPGGLLSIQIHASSTVEKLEGPSNLMLNIVGALTFGIGSKAILDETNHKINDLADSLPSPTIGLVHNLPKLRRVNAQITFTTDPPIFLMGQGGLKFAISASTVQTEPVACDIQKEDIQAQRFFQSCASPISEYKVVEGDNLWKVAEKLYGDGQYYHVIASANGLTVNERDNLRLGATLTVPPFYKLVADSAVLVEAGDSLWNISQKQLGDGRRYKELKGVSGEDLDPSHIPVLESVQLPSSK